MSVQVVAALKALQSSRFREDLVFSMRIRVSGASHRFARIVKRAGLVDRQGRTLFTAHNLRDTFITNLLVTGTDPKTVQSLAGHANMQTTMKYYAMVRAKSQVSAIDRLGQFASETA